MHASAPPVEPGARRSVRVLLRAGPLGRAIAQADLRLYRLIRTAARPPALDAVGRFSRLGEGIFRRARPTLEDLPALIATPTALSFPSAHASSSFAAARAYSGLLPARPLYATAAAMALSRVYLGVHYPTDILAGAVLGTLTGSAGR